MPKPEANFVPSCLSTVADTEVPAFPKAVTGTACVPKGKQAFSLAPEKWSPKKP
jgi:hypothetical protein